MWEYEIAPFYRGLERELRISLEIDTWILGVYGSFGDVFQTVILLPEFERKHGGPICLLVAPHRVNLIREMLEGKLNPTIISFDTSQFTNFINLNKQYEFCKNSIIPTLPTQWPLFPDLVYSGFVSDMNIRRAILRLDRNCKLMTVNSSEAAIFAAKEKLIAAGGFVGKTVIISPYNNSQPVFPIDFWIYVVNLVKSYGFQVLLNTTGFDPANLQTIPSVNQITLDPLPTIVEVAGYHISGSNGLALALYHSYSSVKMLQFNNRKLIKFI
jgi:hypothetical protein